MEKKVERIKKEGVVVGIDASRNRSGGAKSHLVGILTQDDPFKYGVREVHLWSYQSLLNLVPDQPWLVKHNPKELEKPLYQQLYWQCFRLPSEIIKAGCEIILNTDAGTISRFRPSITMSRDMLSYEPGEIERFGFSRARLRLILLRYIQNNALRRANGAVFLTRYASEVIQRSCGPLSRVAHIPHGVSEKFKASKTPKLRIVEKSQPIECLYISNAALYKHQWIVVKAIAVLRDRGYNIRLTLVGGGSGKAKKLLDNQIEISDPNNSFVVQRPFVPQNKLPDYLEKADIFIFASSCENMPNTLIEAMAMGLPIACSNRGPMPEVLEGGGVYFDPENSISIAKKIEMIINDPELCQRIASKAKQISNQYTWSRCAEETWKYIVEIYNSV
ncbi:glycosyltransferase family 4 protein [Endozoicomonas sp. SM1973]|uniref:Glycosyltransferase family 4 protein n=1 Tax=Spartinivicinus marinus TaxID=2994442 RepID=A0A853I2K3_9GAMM|nr:glycosyltransferase family 1 protein [Spartinivicinus marinus]MCX4028810.1 glycosyltransferase family 1 protein [Spartinivicinus marinus]NYZ67623.1 glycosyltransferase family 4 protein [Spartinivicinus marinus]